MTEGDWLAALAQAPDDDAPRLVYADWLDEQGDGRAELLRLASRSTATADVAGWDRLYELAVGADPDWLAAVLRPGRARPSMRTVHRLLGQDPDSPGLRTLRHLLGGKPRLSGFSDCFFHCWQTQGLSLRFQPDPDTLTVVFFYAEGADGFAEYQGELPAGLTFADTRGDVERKLGRSSGQGGEGIIPYWAEYARHGVTITFVHADPAELTNPIHHLAVYPAGRA
jgi:uncharacterized protein (TIGR02996 family)